MTEIAYGAHRDEKYDFIDLNDQLAEIIHKVLTGYIVDLLPWREYRKTTLRIGSE